MTSKTIKLTGSKNNNKLLNNYFDVNVIAGTFDINVLQKCIVIEDGIVILDDVYLQLIKVTKVQSNGQHDQLVSYEVLIKDSTADFFTIVGNDELSDLSFQTEVTNHLYTSANIVNSFTNTWEDVYKYVMPTHVSDNTYLLNEWMPGIYAKQYWDKIFSNAGFTYTWDSLTGSTNQFDKLIIPFNGKQKDILASTLDDIEVLAETSASTTYNMGTATPLNIFSPVEPVVIDVETKDIQGYYDPTISTYTSAYELNGTSKLIYEIDIDYDIILNNNTTDPVQLTSGIGGYRISFTPVVNGVVGSVFAPVTNFSLILGSTVFPVGDTVIHSVNTSFTVELNTSISDTITLGMNLRQNLPNLFDGQNLPFKVRINSMNIRVIPNVNFLTYTLPVFLDFFIPKKVKQSDFIKAFITRYNLYIEVDPNDTNNLIIKNRDNYYDEGKEENWTKKLNKQLGQELQFLPELASKKLILTDKQDTKDIALEGYLANTNEIYGQIEFTYDNEYIKGTETKQTIFSPTIGTDDTTFKAITPTITAINPDMNIRLLYDGGMFDCEEWFILDFGTTGTSGMTQYPLFSHFDHPTTPTFDINFGQCDFYALTNLQVTNNNMFNLHWRRTINQINSSQMMTAFFDFNASDINRMKLSDRIRIDNSYWNINKLEYNASKVGPTKVELLSIDDDLEFVPFKFKDVIGLSNDKPITNAINNTKYEYLNLILGNLDDVYGSNNIVSRQSTGGIIIGDNNTAGASKSFIFGSGNTTSDGIEKAMIFGDNITADTENALYSNNIIVTESFTIQSGATVNVSGVTFTGLDYLPLSGGVMTGNIVSTDSTATGTTAFAWGTTNQAGGTNSFVAGGYLNQATYTNAAILGGVQNTNSGYNGAIAGGRTNNLSGYYSMIGGGIGNNISGQLSGVIGGNNNIITGNRSAIIGGQANSATTTDTAIIGGRVNIVSGIESVIIGGDNHIVDGIYSVVVGGLSNDVHANSAAIVAGTGNILTSGSTRSIITGGITNYLDAERSVILGGNSITGNTDDTVYVPTISFQNEGDRWRFIELDIGDWDMDATLGINVAHGLSATEWKTVRQLDAIIRNDADGQYFPLLVPNSGAIDGGIASINATNIAMERTTGGFFDSTSFNSTSYNRG
ncbi:hypothetical protein KAU11_10025, partial [Candidatus Babeliales bacterium]|nr:hypothetical protein [Candidatus Babeliales bacterium]